MKNELATTDNAALLKPGNGIELRTYLESLRANMKSRRGSLDPLWQQLRAFFAPRDYRSDPSQANNMARNDFEIINECGLLALRVLASGMLTGMSSQTRVWFRIKCSDRALNEADDVRAWCESVEEILRAVMLKSNFYQSLLEMYGFEGLFGTSAFLIESDPYTDIRCHPYPNGSYYLGVDDTLRVDLCCRELSMTARQMVEKFGIDNVSAAVQQYYKSNAGGVQETQYPVAHFIMKGNYFGDAPGQPPWLSIWYEIGAFNDKLGVLRLSGFLDNPLVVGRWRTVGENIYGESPAMDVLGSVMSLQAWEERLAQAAEKQFNPPMIASSSIDPRRLTTLPGEFSIVDTKDVRGAFEPAYQIDFKLDAGMAMLTKIEKRIEEGMFKPLFMMFADSDRREITAEEIRARQQEKMQVLGPVVERNVDEVLAPAIKRILGILQRTPGKLPPMPQSMRRQDGSNVPIGFEFESILATAQKMSGINNIQTVLSIAGQEAALNQGIMDNLDLDETIRQVAKDASLPSKLLRSPEDVAKIRADKQRAQQQQMMAENAQKLAAAAQTAANTPVSGGNLLGAVAPGLAGGGAG